MTDLPMPAVGLRSCSIVPSQPFDAGRLDLVREAGYELIELSFNRAAHGVTYEDGAAAELFRRRAEALGLTFLAHAPDVYWLSNPDRGELEEAIAGVREVLAGAAAYGVTAMVIHCCPGKPLVPGRETEQMEALVHAMESLASTCERTGVCLGAETMVPGRLTSSVEALVEMVDRVDSPWVRICLDTNHANLSQDLNNAVRMAGSRIAELHLNDNHMVKEEHLLPYEGAIDWPAFAGALADIEYSGYMIMEPGATHNEDPDLLAKARRAADRLLRDIAAARSEST